MPAKKTQSGQLEWGRPVWRGRIKILEPSENHSCWSRRRLPRGGVMGDPPTVAQNCFAFTPPTWAASSCPSSKAQLPLLFTRPMGTTLSPLGAFARGAEHIKQFFLLCLLVLFLFLLLPPQPSPCPSLPLDQGSNPGLQAYKTVLASHPAVSNLALIQL